MAEARQNFARLIQRAQRGKPIEITRHGEPVAVLLSASEYQALTEDRPSFIEVIESFRERHDIAELGIGGREFEGLRDPSPGREPEF